jgi:phage baseplate assembly protein W
MIRTILPFLPLIFCVSFSTAESLKPYSEIREKPGGTSMAIFERPATVECDTSRSGWRKTLVYVYFDLKDVIDSAEVGKNVVFYDSSGIPSGKTLDRIVFYRRSIPKGSRLMMQLIGYVQQFNIVDSSVVETHLEKLLAKARSNLSIHEMKYHLQKFPYRQVTADGQITAWVHEESKTGTMNPGLRLMLIFYDDMLLAAVHSRDLSVKNYEVRFNTSRYRVVYLRRSRDDLKERLAGYFPELK